MDAVSRLASRLRHALLIALLALSACHAPPRTADGRMAECPVCRAEGDLACLCVHVEGDTPRCESQGKTYFFCSDECRAEFLARPKRYRKP